MAKKKVELKVVKETFLGKVDLNKYFRTLIKESIEKDKIKEAQEHLETGNNIIKMSTYRLPKIK